jgi:hypothetical protein
MLRKAEADAGPLSAEERASVQKVAGELETVYFAETDPRAAQAFVDRHEWEHRNDPQVSVYKRDDDSSAAALATELRKSDSSLSHYDAILRAHQELAQARQRRAA